MTQHVSRTIHDRMEELINEMVGMGLFWSEASAEFEKLFILRILEECDGNLSRAAETLGIHRNTLSKKVRCHGIEP